MYFIPKFAAREKFGLDDFVCKQADAMRVEEWLG